MPSTKKPLLGIFGSLSEDFVGIFHFGRSTMKRQSALVVFGGGQDSATCASGPSNTMKGSRSRYLCRPTPPLEIQVAREIAEEKGIRHHI